MRLAWTVCPLSVPPRVPLITGALEPAWNLVLITDELQHLQGFLLGPLAWQSRRQDESEALLRAAEESFGLERPAGAGRWARGTDPERTELKTRVSGELPGRPHHPRDGKQALMDSATTANLGHRLVGRKPPARLCRAMQRATHRCPGPRVAAANPSSFWFSPKRNFLPTRSWCSTSRGRSRTTLAFSPPEGAERQLPAPPTPTPAMWAQRLSPAGGIQASVTANEHSWARLQPEL